MQAVQLLTPENGIGAGAIGLLFWFIKSKVVGGVDELKESVADIRERLAKQEFILTGVDEINGVRGDVKELGKKIEQHGRSITNIESSLHSLRDSQQSRLGDWSKWRENVDEKLEKKPRPRRANGGRRKKDRGMSE